MRTFLPAVLLMVAVWPTSLVGAQDQGAKDRLNKLLQSQYVLTKASPDSVNIITPGTVLVIQKDGMVGDAQGTHLLSTPNKYQDGRFKHGIMGAIVAKDNQRTFQTGDRVYLVKIEVKDSDVVFGIVTCDQIDGLRYYANVSFQMGKGYLSGDSGRVQEIISQVFTIEGGDSSAAGGTAAGQGGSQQPLAPIAPPAPPSDEPKAPPQPIELGQTTDQVVAIMGQPTKIVKLGVKQIYVYKDLKVTFKNGKVSDVE